LDDDEPFSQSRERKPSPAIVAVQTESKLRQTIKFPRTPELLQASTSASQEQQPSCNLDVEEEEDEDKITASASEEFFESMDREDRLFNDIDDDDDGAGAFELGGIDDDDDPQYSRLSQFSEEGGRMREALVVDQDNEKYHQRRVFAMQGLSEKDTAALRLGRLVLSSVLNQPEVTAADSISRFFTDIWLSKNGSELTAADTLSMTLMSNIQRSVAEHDPGVDAGPQKTATCQKSVAAVACEALDALILVFGKSNPVLADIREALMPVLFITEPPPTPQPLANPTPEVARDLFPLTGKGYMALPTFCEDTSLIVEDMRGVERALEREQVEVRRLQKERDDFEAKFKESCEKADESYGKLMATLREQERLKGVHKKLKESHEKLKSEHEVATAKLVAETSKHEKLKKEHSLLVVQEAKTKEKYFEAARQKRDLEEQKAALLVDLNYYKNENTTLHNTVSDLKENMEALKRINAKTGGRLQELENQKSTQALLRKETLQRIQKAVSHANSKFTMSSKIHRLLRDPETDVVTLLEQWNIELLERNSELELAMSDGYVESKIQEKTAELINAHNDELKAVTHRMQLRFDSDRKDLGVEVAELKTALDEKHNDLLEMQIEQSSADKALAQLRVKFEGVKNELELWKKVNGTLKVTLVEQLDMVKEDTMLEEKSRALAKWKAEAEAIIENLQKQKMEFKIHIKSK
jgi:hypothetical protein